MPTEELLTERDLAVLTIKSVRTLQGARSRGDGVPFVKLGSHVRYRMADVLRHFEENTKRSTTDSPR